MHDVLFNFRVQPDIICVFEAKLKTTPITAHMSKPGYQLLHNDYPTNAGGVASAHKQQS